MHRVFPRVNSMMLRKIRTVMEGLPILLAFIGLVRIIYNSLIKNRHDSKAASKEKSINERTSTKRC